MKADPRADNSRSASLPFIALGVLAIALRLGVQLWRRGHDPLFHQPINDAAAYLTQARANLSGVDTAATDAPYYLAPLYPRLLAGVLEAGGGALWAMTALQIVLGALTVVGIGLLGRRLFDDRSGLLAGVVALSLAPLLWYEGWLLPTILNLFLLTWGTYLAVLTPGKRRTAWFATVAAGLVLGLAAVNRPQQLLVLVGMAIWLVWRARVAGTGGKVWTRAALLLLGAALAIGPVTVRNLVVGGEPVLITSNGGLNFYLGNHALADGRFSLPDGFSPLIQDQQAQSRQLASQAAGHSLDWQETSRHWFGRGVRELTADPGRALTLAARKAQLLVSWRELENNFVTGWVHRHSGPARVLVPSIAILWVLAVPGVLAARRERRGNLGPLWVVLAATALTCLVFWVSTRNRLPLVIPLAIFAGHGLRHWREWRRPAVILSALVLTVVMVWPTGEREGAGFFVDLGRIHAEQGRVLEARSAFEEALAIAPQMPMALNGLALTYMDGGDPQRAIAILERAIRLYPDFTMARQNLQAIHRHLEKMGTSGTRPR